MGMISEFKEFAMAGNMMDMAVGIIMGGAFGTVIKSLIDDVIMPVVGHFSGGMDFGKLAMCLGDKAADGTCGGAAISYGSFINAFIAFLLLAWVLFMIIKGMNKAKKAEAEAPPEPTPSETLLAEIRDALKK